MTRAQVRSRHRHRAPELGLIEPLLWIHQRLWIKGSTDIARWRVSYLRATVWIPIGHAEVDRDLTADHAPPARFHSTGFTHPVSVGGIMSDLTFGASPVGSTTSAPW